MNLKVSWQKLFMILVGVLMCGLMLPGTIFAEDTSTTNSTTITGDDHLTFTSVEGFSFYVSEPLWDGTLEYSTDNQTWTVWDGSQIVAALYDNQYVICLRGSGNTRIKQEDNRRSNQWELHNITGDETAGITCQGNIMTLLDYKNPDNAKMGDYCFKDLFANWSRLTTAPSLPAMTLSESCYNGMFAGCTSLTQAPVLPATILAKSCYNGMFARCTSLTQAPLLSAENLAESCYAYMFEGCTGLSSAPALPATILQKECYLYMFSGCTGLTEAPELSAMTLAMDCYCGMFSGCTNLTVAPALPATQLADYCYDGMFMGCTNLEAPPVLAATVLPEGCYGYMFENCSKMNVYKDNSHEGYEKPWSIPANTVDTESLINMLSGTAGDVTDTVEAKVTYYIKGGAPVDVYFDMNGVGTQVPYQTVEAGKNATQPADPTASGWVFDGWYSYEDCMTPFDFTSAITEETTIYAKWLANYTVTFDLNGHGNAGLAPEELIVTEGNVIGGNNKPSPEPSDTDCVFGGWYTTKDCETAFDFDNMPITYNTTIYAKWLEYVNVTFEMLDHGTQIPDQSVLSGQTVTKPENPTASGWIFDGWYSDEDCTTSFDFTSEITETTIIYAKWTEKPETEMLYYITSGDNGTWTKDSKVNYEIVVKREVEDEECYSHFASVVMDGKTLVLDTDYQAKSGSTVITLLSATLQELEEYTYSVLVCFDDGEVEATLTIKAAPTPTPIPKSDSESATVVEQKQKVSPETGVNDHHGFWSMLAFASLIGLGGVVSSKKNNHKN